MRPALAKTFFTFNPPAVSAAAPSTLLTGLVAYYPFEANGNDASGNARNLTAVNTPTFGAGKVSNATFLAAASSQNFHISSTDFDPGMSDFSLGGWFRLDDVGGDRHVMFSKGYYFSSAGYQLDLATDNIFNHTGVNFYVGDGTHNLNIENTYSITGWGPGVWRHLILTVTRGGNILVYGNGTLAINMGSCATVTGSVAFPGDNLYIGTNGLAGAKWDGGFDELGFWTKALTADEVAELYNGGTGVTYPF